MNKQFLKTIDELCADLLCKMDSIQLTAIKIQQAIETSLISTEQISIEGYDEILEILINSDNKLCNLELVESNILHNLTADLFISVIKKSIILKKMGYTKLPVIRYNTKDYHFWSKYNKTPAELKIILDNQLLKSIVRDTCVCCNEQMDSVNPRPAFANELLCNMCNDAKIYLESIPGNPSGLTQQPRNPLDELSKIAESYPTDEEVTEPTLEKCVCCSHEKKSVSKRDRYDDDLLCKSCLTEIVLWEKYHWQENLHDDAIRYVENKSKRNQVVDNLSTTEPEPVTICHGLDKEIK